MSFKDMTNEEIAQYVFILRERVKKGNDAITLIEQIEKQCQSDFCHDCREVRSMIGAWREEK